MRELSLVALTVPNDEPGEADAIWDVGVDGGKVRCPVPKVTGRVWSSGPSGGR